MTSEIEFPSHFVSSHGFCVQPKADKMISFSDALVVSWNCLNAKFHSCTPPSRNVMQ